MVFAEDKADLELYAAEVKAKYGIYLTEACKVRLLKVNPRHEAAGRLTFNEPWQLGAAHGAKASRTRARRLKRKAADASEGGGGGGGGGGGDSSEDGGEAGAEAGGGGE